MFCYSHPMARNWLRKQGKIEFGTKWNTLLPSQAKCRISIRGSACIQLGENTDVARIKKAPIINTGKSDWIIGIWETFYGDKTCWLNTGKPGFPRYTSLAKYGETEVFPSIPYSPQLFPALLNRTTYVAGLFSVSGHLNFPRIFMGPSRQLSPSILKTVIRQNCAISLWGIAAFPQQFP